MGVPPQWCGKPAQLASVRYDVSMPLCAFGLLTRRRASRTTMSHRIIASGGVRTGSSFAHWWPRHGPGCLADA